jgi:hypothetical protein
MSFFEKVKAATGQAAERLKDEATELAAKRKLAQAYSELGKQVADLVGSGQLSHDALTGPVDRIRQLKAEIEAAERGGTGSPAAPES